MTDGRSRLSKRIFAILTDCFHQVVGGKVKHDTYMILSFWTFKVSLIISAQQLHSLLPMLMYKGMRIVPRLEISGTSLFTGMWAPSEFTSVVTAASCSVAWTEASLLPLGRVMREMFLPTCRKRQR